MRVEVETALRANVPVVPVFVSNATMPLASELPKSIRKLVSRAWQSSPPRSRFQNRHQAPFSQIAHARGFKVKPKPDNDQGKDPTPKPPQLPARRTRFRLFAFLLLLSCVAAFSIGFLGVLDRQSVPPDWFDKRPKKLDDSLDKPIVDANNLLNGDNTSKAAVPVFINRGDASAHKGRFDKGLADFEAASKINPTDATAHHWQGLILARMGNSDKARIAYDQAVKLDKSFATYPKNRAGQGCPAPGAA